MYFHSHIYVEIDILSQIFKDKNNFNQWFNDNFEKYRSEDPNERGHGEWLKSDTGFINIDDNVSMSNMNEIFEQKKKQIQ